MVSCGILVGLEKWQQQTNWCNDSKYITHN